MVMMFHFEDWPDQSIPKDSNKLLKLINKVQDCKKHNRNQKPIVVMCRYLSTILDYQKDVGIDLKIEDELQTFSALYLT